MINPSNIICEVWDMYEWDQYCEVWNRLDRSGDTLVWNSEDSEAMDDLLYYSEFFYYTTDQILDTLEKRGEWVNCKHSPLDWESEYDYFPEDVLDWEQEYKLFLEAEYEEGLMYLDVIYDHTQEMVLYKAERFSRKKAKHQRDNRLTTKPVKKRRIEGCGCDVCQKSWSWGHKHLRAQKVYTSEESNIYYNPLSIYSDDFYDIGIEGLWEWDFELDQTVEYCVECNEDLSEMGDDEYRSDFDWQEHSVCKPPKGTNVVFKDYSTCAYCGNKHQHCNCFE